MPKGSVPKRDYRRLLYIRYADEAKKPKKKTQKRETYISPIVAGETVEVVGKRRRRKADDDF